MLNTAQQEHYWSYYYFPSLLSR